jgi:hypothetical protein
MVTQINIEKAVKDLMELFARADGVKAQLVEDRKEAEALTVEMQGLREDIAKARKRKDGALAKRREIEAETEKDIAYYKRDAKSYKAIADKKRKEVFDEMQADVDKAVANHQAMLKENTDLEKKIKDTKLKLQQVKEGIIT